MDYSLPFITSRLLNDEVHVDGGIASRTDTRCGGCGSKIAYCIRYLLCDRCLSSGNPSVYATKTKRDKVGS